MKRKVGLIVLMIVLVAVATSFLIKPKSEDQSKIIRAVENYTVTSALRIGPTPCRYMTEEYRNTLVSRASSISNDDTCESIFKNQRAELDKLDPDQELTLYLVDQTRRSLKDAVVVIDGDKASVRFKVEEAPRWELVNESGWKVSSDLEVEAPLRD